MKIGESSDWPPAEVHEMKRSSGNKKIKKGASEFLLQKLLKPERQPSQTKPSGPHVEPDKMFQFQCLSCFMISYDSLLGATDDFLSAQNNCKALREEPEIVLK